MNNSFFNALDFTPFVFRNMFEHIGQEMHSMQEEMRNMMSMFDETSDIPRSSFTQPNLGFVSCHLFKVNLV